MQSVERASAYRCIIYLHSKFEGSAERRARRKWILLHSDKPVHIEDFFT